MYHTEDMSLFDKYLILKIFSFLRYRDVIRYRRINKFFLKELDSREPKSIFWKEFLSHRDNPNDYLLTYIDIYGSSNSHIIRGDPKDAEDMICQFLFVNLEILEYMDYSIPGKKGRKKQTIIVWEKEVNQIDMYNNYISQNDGLGEEDYNPETGNPYYFDDLIPEPEFDESWLPYIAEPYSYILEKKNNKSK